MGVRAARRRSGSKSPAAGDGVRSRQPRAAGARAAADVPAILQAIARTAARLCDATDAQIYRVEGDQLRLVAIHGSLPACARSVRRSRSPESCRAASPSSIGARSTCATSRRPPPGADIPGSAPSPRTPHAARPAPAGRCTPSVCSSSGGRGCGRSRRSRSSSSGPSPTRRRSPSRTSGLREALEARNRELTEGLERETATGDILRIISRSLTDVQPVLEAIVESATRLCDASFGAMVRFDGHLLTLPVLSNASTEEREAASSVFPMAPTAGTAAGRAILERRIIHIHDVRQDSEYTATPIQQPDPRLSDRAGRPAAPRRRTHRGPGHVAARGQALLPEADRPDDDLRRPGRHRHRERPPLHGARGAEPRPDRGARAADGDERDPAGHLQLADRRPAGLRHDRRERGTLCVRALRRGRSGSTAS